PDYLNEIVEQLVLLWELDASAFVYGSGKRKSKEQRHYEHLTTFCQKLQVSFGYGLFRSFDGALQTNLWILSQVSCGRCRIWLIQQLYFL
ncbi:hypothetical protein, partial [Lachnoanaerobaculum gingivalis]|uniref:hypothetical protein n=1 Tax=Lachnoanaerobaculum gingivalis TaxID=2490855 RepID=UPI002F3E7EDC